MRNPVLGCLESGEVVVDRFNSHLKSHPMSPLLLFSALSQIASKGRDFLVELVKFDCIVGNKTCIATRTDDKVVFAVRKKRLGATRFVMERSPEPCSSVMIILKKIENDETGKARFLLITAYVGERTPPEPWDAEAFSHTPDPVAAAKDSFDFWNHHALIWDSRDVIRDSITTTCPW